MSDPVVRPKPLAPVLDFKRHDKPQADPPVIMAQRCVCTHSRDAHLAGSGECRPGFVCFMRCQIFKEAGTA